jgi:hypothetical protein
MLSADVMCFLLPKKSIILFCSPFVKFNPHLLKWKRFTTVFLVRNMISVIYRSRMLESFPTAFAACKSIVRSMYVCLYACCMRACVQCHVCVYVSPPPQMYVHMYVCMYVCMHACMQADVLVCNAVCMRRV